MKLKYETGDFEDIIWIDRESGREINTERESFRRLFPSLAAIYLYLLAGRASQGEQSQASSKRGRAGGYIRQNLLPVSHLIHR